MLRILLSIKQRESSGVDMSLYPESSKLLIFTLSSDYTQKHQHPEVVFPDKMNVGCHSSRQVLAGWWRDNANVPVFLLLLQQTKIAVLTYMDIVVWVASAEVD